VSERLIAPARAARNRGRFTLWVTRARAELARHGAKLIVEAPHGARFDTPPVLEVMSAGEGDATFTLRLGRNVSFGRDLLLDVHARGTNVLELGDGVYFKAHNRVQLRGGAIRLGPRCNVRDFVELRSSGELVAGEDVPFSNGVMVHCTRSITLEDKVGLAERVSVLDTDHQADGSDAHFYEQPLKIAPVTIGRNTFVAANAVVLCGARIGRNSVVAANAVVGAGEHPAGHILAGLPAKPIKRLGA
jgi:acetyltransferase-like isoleucine patch superfamily enzyme